MVRRAVDCITIAATLRQTAAAAANVKSEIHMASVPLSVLASPRSSFKRADNAVIGLPFRELGVK